MPQLPNPYEQFREQFAGVWSAYNQLGAAVHAAGPLDAKSRELVKLALAVGAQAEGAVHSHTRRGLEAGLSPEEIRQVAVLALPTLGFPRMMAALTWIDDVLAKK
jgi:4-carboxymuconolactone decarboxylase